MNTFSINKEAQEKIHRIFKEVNYNDPVACLADISNPGKMMDKFIKDYQEDYNKIEFVFKARKIFVQTKNQLKCRLIVVAKEKKEFNIENLIEINGIIFCMDCYELKILQNYCLIFEENRFLLRSGDKVISSLHDLKNHMKEPG